MIRTTPRRPPFRLPRLTPLALALFVVAATGACHKKPKAAPAPVSSGTEVRTGTTTRDSVVSHTVADSALSEAELTRRAAGLRNTLVVPIHFDYDRDELRDDARQALEAKLPILLANPTVTLRIDGHTDARGSAEYNLALGLRRANTAKRYLVDRGVSDARLATASFGSERPVCEEADETCYAQNRRDEFAVTAGAATLARPRP